MLPKRLDLKRSANGPRSQRVRAGKLGQNAVRWSAFVPLRRGTGRALALGQHALQEVVGILDICLGTPGTAEIVQAFQFLIQYTQLNHRPDLRQPVVSIY